MAAPPIHVWMPNQPQPTIARSKQGRCVPCRPNEARANTGKGMPYFVPACALSTMGINTMTLPRKMVRIACHQFIPPTIRLEASM